MLEGCTPWPAELAERYVRQGLWRDEHFGELPRFWAARSGHRTALVAGGLRLDYRELADRVDRAAAGFAASGIRPDDRVVLHLPNVAEFVVVTFALCRIGAKPIFSPPGHRENEIRQLFRISGAVAYVVPDVHHGFDYGPLARLMLDEVPTLRRVFVAGGPADTGDRRMAALSSVDADPVPMPEGDPADVAFLLLSGGTTALPKLIPRTHRDFAYQVRAVGEICGLGPDTVYLAALPIEFDFIWGCPGVLGTLVAGGTVVLADDPGSEQCFRLIEAERVTMTSVVPTVAQLWLEAAGLSDRDLSSLRLVQVGGARLQPGLAARIPAELGCRLQQAYGMTEGLLSMSRLHDDADSVLHTQGSPISPADEIRVVGEDGAEVPAGAVGELLTRGPYTVHGYYRAEEHNALAFTPDGFYRTGDLVRRTPEGRLVVEGRVKDLVNRGGQKVAAGEVEGHLLGHPAVSRAAVVAVPDEFLGERIHAFLVAEGERPALAELRNALHARGLAAYKLPDGAEFVAALPLTSLGKVDKKRLAAAAADPRLPRDWPAPEPISATGSDR